MRKPKQYFEADFETTTAAYSTDMTKVWLYYIENIFDERDNNIGVHMKGFFNFLEEQNMETIVFFHNLNWDGEFLLNYLCENYQYRKQEVGQWNLKLKKGEWNNMSDGVSSHYVIQFINKNDCRIKFLCSYKQLMSSVAQLMGVKTQEGEDKDKIDYDITVLPKSIKDLTPGQITYVKQDVKAVIPHMRELIEKYGDNLGITSSGTAIKMVRKKIKPGMYDMYFDNKINAGYLDKKGLYHEGMWDYLKRGYLGGWTTLGLNVAKTIWDNISVYDINSLYPYIMRNFKLPIGEPIHCRRKTCNHLRFLEVNFDFKIKEGGVPFIPETGGYALHIEYLSEGRNHLGYFTDSMWELIKEEYDVSRSFIVRETHFVGKEGLFKDYIDDFQEMKQHAVKGSFEYLFSKLMQNQVYGKFGMSPLRKKYYFRPFDKEKDTRKDIVIYGDKHKMVQDYDWDLTNPSYIPMALWITSLAKIETIKAANIANRLCRHMRKDGAFLYSDTDSIHLSMCKDCKTKLERIIRVHPTELGAWDNEGNFKHGYYLKRKFYLEFDDIDENVNPKHCGMAGINKMEASKTTYRTIIDEKWEAVKLQRVKVNGGVQLIPKIIKVGDGDGTPKD